MNIVRIDDYSKRLCSTTHAFSTIIDSIGASWDAQDEIRRTVLGITHFSVFSLEGQRIRVVLDLLNRTPS